MTKAERQELEVVWRERIIDLRSSGMTVLAWAQAHQVSEYQVHYWVRKFRSAQQAPGRSRFVPVTVRGPEEEAASPALTVKVGAFAVEVRAGCDMELLGRVVRTLTFA